jgi:hypothetical protein
MLATIINRNYRIVADECSPRLGDAERGSEEGTMYTAPAYCLAMHWSGREYLSQQRSAIVGDDDIEIADLFRSLTYNSVLPPKIGKAAAMADAAQLKIVIERLNGTGRVVLYADTVDVYPAHGYTNDEWVASVLTFRVEMSAKMCVRMATRTARDEPQK